MRILHVWDARGISTTLSKYTDRLFGTESSIITRKSFDGMRFVTKGARVGGPAAWFKARCLLKGAFYDVFHSHGAEIMVPPLKSVYPRKPIILTFYAGMASAEAWNRTMSLWSEADRLFVAHQHYLPSAPQGTQVMPIPIDTEIFRNEGKHEKGLALYRDYGARDSAEEKAKALGLKMETISFSGLPWGFMPSLLNHYEYFMDIRVPKGYSSPFPDLSQAALEALSCGLKVVRWDGQIMEGLPDANKAQNVAAKYYEAYKSAYDQVNHKA